MTGTQLGVSIISLVLYIPLVAPDQDKAVEEAVQKLSSKKASELVSAAKVIAASKDDKAWEKLRQTMIDLEVIRVLEKNTPKELPEEGIQCEEKYKDFAQFLKVVAEGEVAHAIPTLIWLTDQKGYRMENGRWRHSLLYDSFKYISRPSGELLKFCETKMKSDHYATSSLMNALAAYGTPDSARVFEKNIKSDIDEQILVQYRNKYENIKLLLKRCRDVQGDEDSIRYVRKFLLDPLFEEKIPSQYPYLKAVTLPEINPKGEEAKKFIALFSDFLANPGNIPLTEDEKTKFKDLIKKIEENNREDKEKKK